MFHVKSADVTTRVPSHAFFFVSAVFHYLGPAFAVLLFSSVPVLGMAWFRIASAAFVFATWRKPWRLLIGQPWVKLRVLLALGIVLGLMNACFYLAIARLPLGTVGAIEFLGPITLAALGARTRRNIAALVFAAAGGLLLADVRFGGEPLGFVFAIANCALFMLYVVLGHQIAQEGGAGARATNRGESAGAQWQPASERSERECRGPAEARAAPRSGPQAPAAKGAAGIDRLGAAMLVALVTITPIGLAGALPAMTHPLLILAGVGVGICSSVIPYVCDQLAMARLPRATFALLLSLLPASAAVIGVVVLRQIPTPVEIAGILLVAGGVALHQEAEAPPGDRTKGQYDQKRGRNDP